MRVKALSQSTAENSCTMFTMLYFSFSLNQALSNGVEDTDECESF